MQTNVEHLPIRPVTWTRTTATCKCRSRSRTRWWIQRFSRITHQTRTICTTRCTSNMISIVTTRLTTTIQTGHLYHTRKSFSPFLRFYLHPWLARTEWILRLVRMRFIQMIFTTQIEIHHNKTSYRWQNREYTNDNNVCVSFISFFADRFVFVGTIGTVF